MPERIITDPQKIPRDLVKRPTREQLEDVICRTYDLGFRIARETRRSEALSDYAYFRSFMAASLEGCCNKLFVIKRIGEQYIPEAGSILRDLTEIVVDVFWVLSHFKQDKDLAELLGRQFACSHLKQFLQQSKQAREGHRLDHFLKDVNKEEWEELRRKAKAEIRGVKLGSNWRYVTERITHSDYRWDRRCPRAAKVAARIVNLQYAPYLKNLEILSAYTHWDSAQCQQFSDDLRARLFDRYMNIAIGFTHDVITVACKVSDQRVPEECVIKRHEFIYMST